MLKIIEKTKIWFVISCIIILVGIGFMATKGLDFGIDFKGGTKLVLDFGKEFNKAEVDAVITKEIPDAVTNTIEDTGKKNQLEIKVKKVDPEKQAKMLKEVKEKYKLDDKALVSEDTIGASVGQELAKNSLIGLGVAMLGILLYVAFRFEFNFGLASVIAIIHDVLITLTIYAVFQVPVNTPFIAAILTIIGYSINDTIVIFDRIRENSKHYRSMDDTEVANLSITQTFARSINTTLTTLITIVCVYFFVPSVREFAFPLVIGIATGAYSSIFIASPIWVLLRKRKKKIK
ncbi:preprotein translocase subunit SecF [Clostridium cavendishii DSM 21758]|uniref:Protein-export membrane protein SecF n=1 Tax=Clostridium cavendishii DSM 21758 TaxID=1121302 RepID=A0A1M6AB07_9CLOT|nr:protein translocase subunit SecF [Clostridium cavendishii]SHI33616.1 preprotein translocase subunit SecF [Clostridium cavendishii DSM 21758]